jgi:hypothetical protein
MTRWHFGLAVAGFVVAVEVLGHATLAGASQQERHPASIASVEPSRTAGVDAVVALLTAKMSETLIIKTIQNGGTVDPLTLADVVKLQQAGASERIIEAMMAGSSAGSATPTEPSRPVPAPAGAPRATPPTPAAVTDAEKPRRPSLFGRAAERLKTAAARSADKAVSNAEASIENAIEDASSAVDDTVENKLGSAEKKADAPAEKPTRKPSDGGTAGR